MEQVHIERWKLYLWNLYTYKDGRCTYGTDKHRKMESVSMEQKHLERWKVYL
jgi:hypothetical protein